MRSLEPSARQIRAPSSNVVLTPSNAHYFSELGESVAVQGNLVIGGAPFTMNWQGSAYIYELP